MFLEPQTPVSEAAARRTMDLTAWDAIMYMAFTFLGISLLGQFWLAFHPGTTAVPSTEATVFVIVLTGVVPVAWLLSTRQKPVRGAMDYLGIHWSRRSLSAGLLAAAALWLLAFVVHHLPLTGTGSVAAMLVLPAATAEEILFRGVLLRRVGVTGQAGLFGLFHAAGGPEAILFATLAGIVLGVAASRWGLTASTTAHALYNAVGP